MNITWITNNLALGEAPTLEDTKLLESLGITAILNLQLQSQIPTQLPIELQKYFEWRNVPLADGAPIELDKIIDAVDWIKEKEKTGKVYVHCTAGLSRSPAILMCYFISKGYPSASAHNKIESKRKRIWISPTILPSLYEFEKYYLNRNGSKRKPTHATYEELERRTYKKLSKFISYVLKHNPTKYCFEMDKNGFVSLDDLLSVLQTRYEYRGWISKENIYELNEKNDKQRFEIKDDKIRAF